MVIWLVGLSGSGKTTIGKEMYKLWKPIAPNTVMVDGDDVRTLMGKDKDPSDFTLEGRYRLTLQYVEICAWLDQQDINVICCTISNFEDIYNENRKRFSNYFQVFLDVPIDILKKRDPKGLYKRVEEGIEKNVMGVDIPYSKPVSSDLHLVMDRKPSKPDYMAEQVLKCAEVISKQ